MVLIFRERTEREDLQVIKRDLQVELFWIGVSAHAPPRRSSVSGAVCAPDKQRALAPPAIPVARNITPASAVKRNLSPESDPATFSLILDTHCSSSVSFIPCPL